MSQDNFVENMVEKLNQEMMLMNINKHQDNDFEDSSEPEAQRSKTDFVRQILREIGAVSGGEPPEGWVKQVEKRLADNNMKMHRNTIYFTRRNMLKSQGKKNTFGKNQKLTKSVTQEENSDSLSSIVLDRPLISQNQLNAFREVQKLAVKFGGLRQLAGAVDFLISIKENRS